MQAINDDPLKKQVRVNWKTAVKNPYINKFTKEEKLKIILDCFIDVEKISKDELRREIDLALA